MLTGPASAARVRRGLRHPDSDSARRLLDACKSFKEQNKTNFLWVFHTVWQKKKKKKVVKIFIQLWVNWTFGTFSAPSRCNLPCAVSRNVYAVSLHVCAIVFGFVPEYLSAFELINKPVLEKRSVDVLQLKKKGCLMGKITISCVYFTRQLYLS